MSKTTLTREEILHLASLANLKLTDEEVKKFQSQLSSIVDYISKLDQVDTKNITAISQITGLMNVTREDCENNERTLTQDAALKNAKNKKDHYFKVKAIFEE